MKISVISPVYQAEKIIDELVSRVRAAISILTDDYEIILVDDGSLDASWEKIKENCEKCNKIKGIKLSRNFGQHRAIMAGLKCSNGDFVIVLDCDLQDNPKYIADLFKKITAGYDVVYAHKKFRKHRFLKNLSTMFFYKIFLWISEQHMDLSAGGYSILSRRIVNLFLKFNDSGRGYSMPLKWLGYRQGYIEIEHGVRYEGESAYSLKKLVRHAILAITFYSDALLRLSIYGGLLFSFISFLGVMYLVYNYLFWNVKEGWTSIMVMLSLIGGLILLSLGILGLYISQIFEQVKNRPIFLIQESLNCKTEELP